MIRSFTWSGVAAGICVCSLLVACGSGDRSSLFGPLGASGEAGFDNGSGGGPATGGTDQTGAGGETVGASGGAGEGGVASDGGASSGGSGGDLGSGGSAGEIGGGSGGADLDASTGGEPGDSSIGSGGSAAGGASGSGGAEIGGSGGDATGGAGGVATGGSGGAGGATGGAGGATGGAGGATGGAGGATGGAAGTGGSPAGCIDKTDCQNSFGPGYVCVSGNCVPGDCTTDASCSAGQICGLVTPFFCHACTQDTQCVGDPNYGAGTICVSGACITGDCHATADCSGKLCTNHTCVACTGTPDCITAFGNGYLCVAGTCVKGNCTTDGNCAAGQICGLSSANVCGACTTDTQCKNDVGYGSGTVCVNGACITGNCHADGDCSPAGHLCVQNKCQACASTTQCHQDLGYGSGDVCSGGACVPGNCVATTDCAAGLICGVATKNVCGACTGDNQCKNDTRYGGTFICNAGSCVVGDCHTDNDCNTGQICGVTSPNHCGKCTTDAQCKSDTTTYGAGFVCGTGGACVDGSCNTNHTQCSQKVADFCCTGSCIAGDCCDASDCTSLGKNYTCVSNACTQCGLPSGNDYYVDPVNGSDSIGTGSNATPGCAFKTIARALTVITNTAKTNTRVLIIPSGSLGTATGETFPIDVPTNVTISGSGGVATILVPKGATGFTLDHASSGLALLLIDGQSHLAGTGIAATTGAASATTSITNVTVQNMSGDGITVGGTGGLTIGEGVSSTGNGVHTNGTTEVADGLQISGTGKVVINNVNGASIHFDGNAASGIYVSGTGALTLTGTPGVGGDGTVTANTNGHAGIWVEQEATGGLATPPVNSVTGVVAWANTGDGIRVAGGSSLTLRGSYLLANGGSGVDVVSHVVGLAHNNVVSRINLGTTGVTGSNGANVLQAGNTESPNLGAGICLAIDRVGNTLNAAGNIFAGPTDCGAVTAGLNAGTTCTNGVDYALTPNFGGFANTIVLTGCH